MTIAKYPPPPPAPKGCEWKICAPPDGATTHGIPDLHDWALYCAGALIGKVMLDQDGKTWRTWFWNPKTGLEGIGGKWRDLDGSQTLIQVRNEAAEDLCKRFKDIVAELDGQTVGVSHKDELDLEPRRAKLLPVAGALPAPRTEGASRGVHSTALEVVEATLLAEIKRNTSRIKWIVALTLLSLAVNVATLLRHLL